MASGPFGSSAEERGLLPDADRHRVVARHRHAELGAEAVVVGDEVAHQVLAARGIKGSSRFVFWEQSMGQPQSKATAHVADLGTGPRFAPLSRQESEGGSHINDFAFATTN